MAVNPANLRSIYRSLLRELPPRPVLATPRTPLHIHIRESFSQTSELAQSSQSSSSSSASASSTSPTPAQHPGEALAAQLAIYLRSQRTYATLLERYNPGMDMDDEERIRLTARRVGLDLPVGYKNEEEGK